MKKIAVILSGCGHKDGSEITETVSTLIALSSLSVEIQCYAPNISHPVKNHLTDELTSETRNLLTESARITRGHSKDLETLNAIDYDALVLPGGFGAALTLSDWAQHGSKCKILPHLEKVIIDFYNQSKPIGAICISPVILARVLGKNNISVTIGDDAETIREIEKTGALHEACPVNDFITDRGHKIITTPAYMYDAKPHEVFQGISGMLRELVEMA